MQSPKNRAVIAAAGSGKTQAIIDGVLGRPDERALILTYTLQNQLQVERRLHAAAGGVPPNARVAGWMAFLLSDGIRPYQHSILNEIDRVRGLNFEGPLHKYVRRGTRRYYLDSAGDAYGRNLADFACLANQESGGEVIRRLETIYDHIYIDEVQDLAGYDLDFLDLLFASEVTVTMVGDPRQCLLATARVMKNKKYRGEGLLNWLDERTAICTREDRPESWRCHQDICDFASELFPNYPPMISKNTQHAEHQGVHMVEPLEVHEYVEHHRPRVLRYDKRADTLGHSALNIGEAKGSSFDHVLIFPTGTMLKYLRERDPSAFKSCEHLYVAVTRARHSVGFVGDQPGATP